MKNEIILSAGIDIGTTTTHLIISKIGISVTGGFGAVPSAQITSKEIVYKSPVYFTPLLPNGDIDGKSVTDIIRKEYAAAGFKPADFKSGAVIITGESACKSNSADVLAEISDLAGDFIAAQAGSELESVLSGKGAGADKLSSNTGKTVANIDIGGGTTNISVFENGNCIDTCCLNIGGRLIKMAQNGVYISDIIKKFINDKNLKITDFENSRENIRLLCDMLADMIFAALGFCKFNIPDYIVNDHLLSTPNRAEILTFSGGVADCMKSSANDFPFGDIGAVLGNAVLKKAGQYKCSVADIDNPIRATVIGAGQFSMNISGSTIQYSDIDFPLKNLPCVCSLSRLGSSPCAICPGCKKSPSFAELDEMARNIVAAAKNITEKNIPLVVITKEDYSKALGQCIKRKLPKNYPFLCADGIECKTGDYIDIGAPVADGKAVPVVVKTLVFGG